MTGTALVIVINVFTSIIKQWIYPKFGRVGVQIVAFVLALIGSAYYIYLKNIVSIETFVAGALTLFSLAVTFYEVILQYVPFFQAPDVNSTPVDNS